MYQQDERPTSVGPTDTQYIATPDEPLLVPPKTKPPSPSIAMDRCSNKPDDRSVNSVDISWMYLFCGIRGICVVNRSTPAAQYVVLVRLIF